MVDRAELIVFGIAVTSSFIHAFESLIVKQISSLTALEMAFMRMIVQTIILVPICQYRYNKQLPKSDIFQNVPVLLLYGFNVVACVVTGFKSFVLLPIGDAVALGSTFIIWTCLFGWIFLKEKLHWVDMLMIPVTICGIVLIARPPFIFGGGEYDEDTLTGVFFAIISSVAAGGLYVSLRKIGSDVHFTITALYYSMTGLISIGLILSITSGFKFICQNELPYTLWLGVNGLVAMTLLQFALSKGKAVRVGIMTRSIVIFTYIFQVAFTDDKAEFLSLVGASLILLAALCMSVRKLISNKIKK